jgi:hypothetical protein
MVSAPATGRIGVPGAGESSNTLESSISAINWPAIFGGAFAAAAFSLILLALGSGFGLASVSPWSNTASATTFTVMTAIWLIVVQWVSAGLGGYLTGRLRTKWVGVHTHEVFFRDTANGFLAWAVAAVIGAAVLASAVSSLLGGGTHVAATIASGAAAGTAQGTVQANPSAYLVDSLFRSDHPNANAGDNQEVRAETGRILVTGIKNGDVPAGDRTYLAQLVAARTGLSEADAQKRVDDVIAKAKAAEAKARQVVDEARKAGAYLSIFTAVSMLIGAFIAAAAAALGGQHRDEDWRAHPGLQQRA